ncbi:MULTISPECIES: GAD-like domain-containing protein [Pseudomonas]|uniref:DUF1851 domain-containing protein n=1 Tax=Pseudomonas quercus TaxID=2722792 RepID=A0ABX0YCX9_9PSED|nr:MULTISPECIES: GAD-like domain-containing protein [Pseudomonas]MBF7142676.1 DUF1851 domain-containing protein [Pseudomonas sp. LY10J]NJP01214.1 DUF1851 domain-containing protein [Pseudomonas quercus]
MDEAFAVFIEKLGQPTHHQVVPAESIEHYKGKLPKRLLEYWAEHGWSGYGDGLLWFVDPRDYEGVVASWIEGTKLEARDTYHLIARGAFGDLYLWGEKTGPSVKITSMFSRCSILEFGNSDEAMDRSVQNFILSLNKEGNDFEGMFKRAKKKLGVLKPDEMYGFAPALILGGPDTFDHLQKVKAVEHLMLLSQLTELEPYSFADI